MWGRLLQNIANSDLVSEAKYRLNNLDIDSLLSTGQLEQLIENRETKEIKDENKIPLYKEDSNFYNEQMIMPIISTSGDCIGSIVIVAKENEKFQEGTDKILKVACSFLGKQVQ